ncbi:hypothetical protein H0A36_19530 [Endozoicomonas sp. SM1973]|uniref:Uncharacterized protein n=1 Tax=Spartinivicinus marinus TaxID=2994442 RepID=A0A853IDT6_9GAMM|nr:hypothetical protein [Spartinivicinus marinus]MCX4027541.1 hypothetical protein [Spartinivicinus marinus]NYZ68214.1 hypothetical protein [Spartinivicinus marinus]
MMKSKTLTVFGVLMSSVMTVSSYAADIKNYQGTHCVPITSSSTYSSEYRYSHPFGYVQNTSSSKWLYLECPLVRDDTTANNQASAGYVRVKDQNASLDVECAFYRVYDTGNVAGGSVKRSSGSSTAMQQLDFPNLNQGGSKYTMHMKCKLPPSSKLYSYSANEL